MAILDAVINTAYVLAGVALFATGEAPVIQPEVDFWGDTFSVAWAGWKFCGCLYMALVNWGVSLERAGAIVMAPYILFDIYAVMDDAHWTSLAYGFIVLEALTLITALNGNLKVGGVINALYVLAGVVLFSTGEAPVIAPNVDFLGNTFACAWAGWKFSGCLFYALLNLGANRDLSMALCMIPYVAFDVYAVLDHANWTPLAAGFIFFDMGMFMRGTKEFLMPYVEMLSKEKEE